MRAKTSGVARDFKPLQKLATANFQDRLVMTTSITLRRYDATQLHHIYGALEMWLEELLLFESASHIPLEDRQACLSRLERGYSRHRRNLPPYHGATLVIFAMGRNNPPCLLSYSNTLEGKCQ